MVRGMIADDDGDDDVAVAAGDAAVVDDGGNDFQVPYQPLRLRSREMSACSSYWNNLLEDTHICT